MLLKRKTNSPVNNIVNRAIFMLILLLSPWWIDAQARFEFTPDLKEAYFAITNLELEKGQILIDQIKVNDPSNSLSAHIENYIDFFRCFIDEEESHFEQVKSNKDIRLNTIRSGDENSPYYLFSQAEVLLQWALVRLKFEEYTTALLEMNKAIKLLEENDEKFPDFIANKKSLSALHAMVGTIPNKYRNMLSWVSSFNGTIEQGYQEIQEVFGRTNPDNFVFYNEVLAIKALIELHFVNDKNEALETVKHPYMDAKNNPLLCFIVANVHHKAGYNDEAISVLEDFQISPQQHPLYYLDYLRGIYKLDRLDIDSDVYIRRYLNYFHGRNYIKEAYQKLAWYEWAIHGDEIEYRRNISFCIRQGKAIIDEDKQAESYAKSSVLPQQSLLRARLLDDGSYKNRALQELDAIDIENFESIQRIEYFYRKARIEHGLNRFQIAEADYLKCLEFPFNEEVYFQTAAALYLGQLYESSDDKIKASYYYESCLKLNPEQYKSSLHQKAKAGLQRVR